MELADQRQQHILIPDLQLQYLQTFVLQATLRQLMLYCLQPVDLLQLGHALELMAVFPALPALQRAWQMEFADLLPDLMGPQKHGQALMLIVLLEAKAQQIL